MRSKITLKKVIIIIAVCLVAFGAIRMGTIGFRRKDPAPAKPEGRPVTPITNGGNYSTVGDYDVDVYDERWF